LSEMLRYLLYRCLGEKVSLEEEIGFLQDYIGLQAIRSDAGSEVRFEVPDHETPHEIAPFLLLPLVENVFKHGTMSGRGESFAEISIKTRENKLEFTTSNHAVDNSQGDSRDGEMIGIRNVERRLHLLYPGAHEFRYGFSGGKFLVKLNISL